MITTVVSFFFQTIWHALQRNRVVLALRMPCLITLGFLFLCICIAIVMGALYLLLLQIQ